jgi:hypothetical protein
VVEGLGGGERAVCGGWFWAPRQKRSCWGLVSANKTLGVLDFGPEDGNEVGYTMVEEFGGGEWVACSGGVVLANKMQWVTRMHQGGFCEVAEHGG